MKLSGILAYESLEMRVIVAPAIVVEAGAFAYRARVLVEIPGRRPGRCGVSNRLVGVSGLEGATSISKRDGAAQSIGEYIAGHPGNNVSSGENLIYAESSQDIRQDGGS